MRGDDFKQDSDSSLLERLRLWPSARTLTSTNIGFSSLLNLCSIYPFKFVTVWQQRPWLRLHSNFLHLDVTPRAATKMSNSDKAFFEWNSLLPPHLVPTKHKYSFTQLLPAAVSQASQMKRYPQPLSLIQNKNLQPRLALRLHPVYPGVQKNVMGSPH